jgi:hypothetical protein
MFQIKNLFKKKDDPTNPRYRREMAERICRAGPIKYVTERKNDDVEEVVGRGGSMIVKDGEFIVHTNTDTVFRCPVDELEAWELMSKDGVVLTGPDGTRGGAMRTVTAFYVYYRK